MGDIYGECKKSQSHIGGKTDGCQEFMVGWQDSPSNCRVCNCHQNFHRKVVPPVVKYEKEIVYTKCHKIHDFKFQNSVDGCQEFTPAGPDGTRCDVCGCHKGFHRTEVTKQVA